MPDKKTPGMTELGAVYYKTVINYITMAPGMVVLILLSEKSKALLEPFYAESLIRQCGQSSKREQGKLSIFSSMIAILNARGIENKGLAKSSRGSSSLKVTPLFYLISVSYVSERG